jgi:hypothetical protein
LLHTLRLRGIDPKVIESMEYLMANPVGGREDQKQPSSVSALAFSDPEYLLAQHDMASSGDSSDGYDDY